MPNMEFSFIYRDAANYKTFSSLVFANPDNLPLETIRQTILASCNANGNFDPEKWVIPNIRTQPYDPELDHGWFEYESVEETNSTPTDARTISKFLIQVRESPMKV